MAKILRFPGGSLAEILQQDQSHAPESAFESFTGMVKAAVDYFIHRRIVKFADKGDTAHRYHYKTLFDKVAGLPPNHYRDLMQRLRQEGIFSPLLGQRYFELCKEYLQASHVKRA